MGTLTRGDLPPILPGAVLRLPASGPLSWRLCRPSLLVDAHVSWVPVALSSLALLPPFPLGAGQQSRGDEEEARGGRGSPPPATAPVRWALPHTSVQLERGPGRGGVHKGTTGSFGLLLAAALQLEVTNLISAASCLLLPAAPPLPLTCPGRAETPPRPRAPPSPARPPRQASSAAHGPQLRGKRRRGHGARGAAAPSRPVWMRRGGTPTPSRAGGRLRLCPRTQATRLLSATLAPAPRRGGWARASTRVQEQGVVS